MQLPLAVSGWVFKEEFSADIKESLKAEEVKGEEEEEEEGDGMDVENPEAKVKGNLISKIFNPEVYSPIWQVSCWPTVYMIKD